MLPLSGFGRRSFMPKLPVVSCATPAGVARRDVLRGILAITVLNIPIVGCGSTKSGAAASPYEPDGRPIQDLPADSRVPILWVEAGVCTGCSCSLLDSDSFETATLPLLRLEFAETLMEQFGSDAIDHILATAQTSKGQYILVVDGAVPVDTSAGAYSALTTTGQDSSGTNYTVFAMISALAANAKQVVAIGACASFGGIPGSNPNTGIEVSLADAIAAAGITLPSQLIRVPGCPPNPVWAVDTFTTLLTTGFGPSDLDYLGRPLKHFGDTVHDNTCPRRPSFDASLFTTVPGDMTPVGPNGEPPCLLNAGCKGVNTFADCPKQPWQGKSWCIQAGAPCIGCAAPGFLDGRTSTGGITVGGTEPTATSPFYVKPAS
jgi:hydrogenase small subunit